MIIKIIVVRWSYLTIRINLVIVSSEKIFQVKSVIILVLSEFRLILEYRCPRDHRRCNIESGLSLWPKVAFMAITIHDQKCLLVTWQKSHE